MIANINKNQAKMFLEIKEQVGVISAIMNKHLVGKRVIFNEILAKKNLWQKERRFTFWGMGSSYVAGLWGSYIFEEITGFPCEAEFADEVNRRKNILEQDTVLVVLSQSGETKEVIRAAVKAKQQGVLIISLTNSDNSSLAKLADININLAAGYEKAVAATKTFSAELFNLLLLAMHVSQEQGRVHHNANLFKIIQKLPEHLQEMIDQGSDIENLAKQFREVDRMTILGSSYSYPIALEGALKLKETAYVQAEAHTFEEFRHGPIAVVEESYPMLALVVQKNIPRGVLKILAELKEKGVRLVIVGQRNNKDLARIDKSYIQIPSYSESLSSFISLVFLQQFAFYLAISKGIDINNPRNIQKVTN